MSNTGDQETRGASITPSARPSIHNHGFCPFAYAEAMGRYGIGRKRAQSTSQTANRSIANRSIDNGTGIDEVDNTLSKPALIDSVHKEIDYRRKSLDGNMQEVGKESNTSILSKSLPATFPPHSYCSVGDKSLDGTPVQPEQYSINTSDYSNSFGNPLANTNTPVYRRTPGSNGSNSNHSSPVLTPYQNLRLTKASPAEGSSKMTLPLLLLVGGLITAASMLNTTNISNKVIYDESRFYNDIDGLGYKYGIDGDAVLQMQTGIATIFEKQDTGSFMFVYNSDNNNFIPNEFNMFINDVSNIASKYLRNESTPVHYTLVEGSTLNVEGPSELINTFRKDLDRTGVMLVKHVEAIPSALAMAFHFYCDEYNPLVKKSAIFFTLNLAKCAVLTDKRATHAVIEKCLMQKWSGVPADSIAPLLTRVVNVVIDLTGPS